MADDKKTKRYTIKEIRGLRNDNITKKLSVEDLFRLASKTKKPDTARAIEEIERSLCLGELWSVNLRARG